MRHHSLTWKEAEMTGLPFYTGNRWIGRIEQPFIGLSESRCAELGVPVQPNEKPVAYRHIRLSGGVHRYFPLYNRTSQVPIEVLNGKEFVSATERQIS